MSASGDQAREWVGLWWLPESQDSEVSGTLHFDPHDGLRLEIQGAPCGTLIPPPWEHARAVDRWDVIHGVSKDGVPITLEDCALHRLGGLAVITSSLHVGRMYAGGHFLDLNADEFDCAELNIDGLTHLAWSGGVDDPFETRIFDAGEGFVGRLRLDGTQSSENSPRGLIRRTHREVVLSVESPSACGVDELLRRAWIAEAWVAFVYQRPLPVASRRVRSTATDPHAGTTWVEVWRAPSADDVNTRWRCQDALFTHMDMAPEVALERWFAVMRDYEATCELLLSLMLVPGGFINPRVVTAVTAAEALQGRLVKQGRLSQVLAMDAGEHKRLRQAALEGLEEADAQWLGNRFPSNRGSLAKRLESLATNETGSSLGRLIPAPLEWAKQAVQRRNDIAHGDSRFLSQELGLLHAVETVTRAVVSLRLLWVLGFDEPYLEALVASNGQMHWVAELAARHFRPSADSITPE